MQYNNTVPHMEGTEQIRSTLGPNYVSLVASDGRSEVGFTVGHRTGVRGAAWLRRLAAEASSLADVLEAEQ